MRRETTARAIWEQGGSRGDVVLDLDLRNGGGQKTREMKGSHREKRKLTLSHRALK
jgi:hypothetical protein